MVYNHHQNLPMTRKSNHMKRRILVLTAVVIILACVKLAGAGDDLCDKNRSDIKGDLTTVLSSNGQPSVLVHYEGISLSFNPELHIPNWVSWELTRDKAQGEEPRFNRFMTDDRIKGCPVPGDYTYSGYDRGHMAPAGDMKWSRKAMKETFYLTNICPQSKQLNTGSWKKLEEKCRFWASVDSVIYIVCGPVLADEPIEYIGETKVAVPRRFFKVIAAPYANPPRGIGFIMNNGRVEGGMQKAAVSIDEVEALTGLDFFSRLPDDIEIDIESQKNFNSWSTMRD